jgi:hypothetical protein
MSITIEKRKEILMKALKLSKDILKVVECTGICCSRDHCPLYNEEYKKCLSVIIMHQIDKLESGYR